MSSTQVHEQFYSCFYFRSVSFHLMWWLRRENRESLVNDAMEKWRKLKWPSQWALIRPSTTDTSGRRKLGKIKRFNGANKSYYEKALHALMEQYRFMAEVEEEKLLLNPWLESFFLPSAIALMKQCCRPYLHNTCLFFALGFIMTTYTLRHKIKFLECTFHSFTFGE